MVAGSGGQLPSKPTHLTQINVPLMKPRFHLPLTFLGGNHMYRLSLRLFLAAILGISVLVSYAFAQNAGKDCGPNSNKCQIHHENCKC